MDALRSVADWPVDSAAVAVGRPDPDGGWRTDVTGDTGRSYPWASVTKLATALAVLVAVEEGTLALDEPAGPPGSTVRHLLAHASGLGPEPGPPTHPPGARRIYSNAGYGVLGAVLEARAGLPFGDYLAEGVLGPLSMSGTVLEDPAAPGVAGAAAGLSGPLDDLVRLAREWASPTLISGSTWGEAVSVQFPGLDGVLPGFGPTAPCDWGLGAEVRGSKYPHWTGRRNAPSTYGHFGQSGSFLWVDPEARVLMAGLSDRRFGVWAARAWPALADAVLAEVAGGADGPRRSDPGR